MTSRLSAQISILGYGKRSRPETHPFVGINPLSPTSDVHLDKWPNVHNAEGMERMAMAADSRVTVHLSLTEDDKRALKVMAAERGLSASALVHEWIEREQAARGEGER